jgi:predicted MFS family arabinose efflux permease
VIGPVLAGLVITVGSIGWALFINTVSFLAVVITLLLITIPATPVRTVADAGWWQSMARGFSFVRREPGLWVSTRAMLLNTFLAAPFIGLVPAVAKKVLHNEKRLSILVTAQGLGAVLGALTVSTLTKRYGGRWMLRFVMWTMPLALIAYGGLSRYGVVPTAIAIGVLGGLYMMALITFSSASQTRAPASLRGRAVSVNTTILGLVYPLGALLQGAIGDRIGLGQTTMYAGIAFAAVVVGVRLFKSGFTLPLAIPAEVAA